eukprot:9481218-Prorocentrum_lima.AAC.1
MQRSYPFRTWTKDALLWEVSTSVELQRRGPLLISDMQGTAKTFMVAQLETYGALYSGGGYAIYYGQLMS